MRPALVSEDLVFTASFAQRRASARVSAVSDLHEAIGKHDIIPSMTPQLPQELCNALQVASGKPLEVEDPQTRKVYVLLGREEFKRLQKSVFDDSDLTAEELLAIAAQGLDDPEGWGAPGMEIYDDFVPPQAENKLP